MRQITLAAIVSGLTVTGVLAHSKAEKTTPADAASVDAVDVIAIEFDDLMRVTAVSMTGPEGLVGVERETGMEPVSEFRARPPDDLPAGTYTVDWRGLSADGHPMQGTFSFTLAD
ncbi:copper resistance CopC family protein [Roseobacter ponti]|uniref:Copper resistance protein CopC n=1 Tax=Roseobacter ponti TaxID=1891787 RepID=A0A858SPU8_9RHOB|nr:copper resistance protein CopC [Roseobacter ponti]QJF50410.1 copper resistance protein CopC [Roseobacter ponti]